MEKISIIIPTYNRAKTLPRTLYSIEKQTVRDFICIIVDDGSTDGTCDLVEKMKKELSFPIEYYYQDNKGVLSARLFGIEKAKTELIMLLDSDDEITDEAVETILKTWYGITPKERTQYYGILCLCRDYETGKIIGGGVREDINNCSYKKYFRFRMHGEQFGVWQRNLLIQQYQEYELIKEMANSKFVPESILHLKYEMRYRFYCINKSLRIYHREDTNSLCRAALTKEGCRIGYFTYTYILYNYFPNVKLPFGMCLSYAMYTIKFAMLLGYKLPKIYKDVGNFRNKMVLTLALPFGLGNYLLGQKIKEE